MVAIRVIPADLLGAGFVVDDREGVVSQRQIRDKLGDAKLERRADDEVGQPDLRGAAERGADGRPKRAGINVDLVEKRGRVRLVAFSGRADALAVEAGLADGGVERALHRQPYLGGGSVDLHREADRLR